MRPTCRAVPVLARLTTTTPPHRIDPLDQLTFLSHVDLVERAGPEAAAPADAEFLGGVLYDFASASIPFHADTVGALVRVRRRVIKLLVTTGDITGIDQSGVFSVRHQDRASDGYVMETLKVFSIAAVVGSITGGRRWHLRNQPQVAYRGPADPRDPMRQGVVDVAKECFGESRGLVPDVTSDSVWIIVPSMAVGPDEVIVALRTHVLKPGPLDSWRRNESYASTASASASAPFFLAFGGGAFQSGISDQARICSTVLRAMKSRNGSTSPSVSSTRLAL